MPGARLITLATQPFNPLAVLGDGVLAPGLLPASRYPLPPTEIPQHLARMI